MYTWKTMTPLTGEEARSVFRKGLMVLCLHSDKAAIAKSEEDITEHAKKGGAFAVDREALLEKETYFVAHYNILYGLNKPLRFSVSKRYATRDDAMDGCKDFLMQSLREHGITQDGEYWVDFSLDKYIMDDCETMTDYGEGFVTVKEGKVTQVPCDFWLPF